MSAAAGMKAYKTLYGSTPADKQALSGAVVGAGGDPLARRNPTRNLLKRFDPDVQFGFYVNYQNGNFLPNVVYNVSGYIPVIPGRTYRRSYTPKSSADTPGLFVGQVVWLDAMKSYLSGDEGTSKTSFVAPDGAAFMQISIEARYWRTAQIEEAATSPTGFALNESVTLEDGNPYQRSALRQTRMRLLGRTAPFSDNVQLIINMAGDSWFQLSARCVEGLTNLWVSRYGDAGGGWCGIGFLPVAGENGPWAIGGAQPQFLNGNARPTLYPVQLFGSVGGTYYTAATADLAFATLNDATAGFQVGVPAAPAISAIDLHYVGSAGASIRYGWASASGSIPASWTTLSLAGTEGATGVTSLSLANIVQPGFLRIERVAGTPKISAPVLKSNAPGVRVNKIAATGSAINNYTAVDVAGWRTSFDSLGGHLTLYLDGTNSQAAGLSGAGWYSAARTIVNRFRGATAASPGGTAAGEAMDVALIVPAENLRGNNTIAMPAYAQAGRRVSYTKRCSLLDLQQYFGDPGSPDYGSSGAIDLFDADGIHPKPSTGGRIMIAAIDELVRP